MKNDQPFGHIMLDLETLGTTPGHAILSFSAVQFNPFTGEVGVNYSPVIKLESCVEAGLKIDPGTIRWWMQQDPAAQQKAFSLNGVHLNEALHGFTSLINHCGGFNTTKIWGNSATFDLGLLRTAYDAGKVKPNWKYTNEMCLRTLTSLYPDIKNSMVFEGQKHNPYADCLHQIKICQAIFSKLNLQ